MNMSVQIKLSELPQIQNKEEVKNEDLIIMSKDDPSIPERYVSVKVSYEYLTEQLKRDLFCFVTFDPQSGTCEEDIRYVFNGRIIGDLPLAIKSNHDFIGWFTMPVNGDKIMKDFVCVSDLTAYAQYNIRTVVITFDSNYGSCLESSREIQQDSPIGPLPVATRPKHNFLGWFDQDAGGSKILETTAFQLDNTIYAHWEKIQETLTLRFYCLDSDTKQPVKPETFQINGTSTAFSFNDSTGYVTTSYAALEDSSVTLRITNILYVTLNKSFIMGNICEKEVLIKKVEGENARIILEWGAYPADLDSHLKVKVDGTQKKHIYYSDKGPSTIASSSGNQTTVMLDVDDITSYGPETTTIIPVNRDFSYCFYVHNWSQKSSPESAVISPTGETRVRIIYNGEDNTYYAETGKTGIYWHVFNIINGEVQKIDVINNTEPSL